MTKYLISFPGKGQAMKLTEEEFPAVVAESHAVIEEAKAAGVYVFGGGIAEDVAPVLVQADGSVGTDIYPGLGHHRRVHRAGAAHPRGR